MNVCEISRSFVFTLAELIMQTNAAMAKAVKQHWKTALVFGMRITSVFMSIVLRVTATKVAGIKTVEKRHPAAAADSGAGFAKTGYKASSGKIKFCDFCKLITYLYE